MSPKNSKHQHNKHYLSTHLVSIDQPNRMQVPAYTDIPCVSVSSSANFASNVQFMNIDNPSDLDQNKNMSYDDTLKVSRNSKDKKMPKRTDYLSWDEYFMGISLMSAKRSKDPETQVGACIVNPAKRIVGVGYNGFPTGCSDDDFPWERTGKTLETKYPYVVHAELNAILNSTTALDNCTIYVALFPCNECAKAIIQSGIREVVYLSDKYNSSDAVQASKKLFAHSGVRFRKLDSNLQLSISFDPSKV